MLQRLDHAIFCIHDRPESFSRTLYTLMVGRIDCAFGTVNPFCKRILFDSGPVYVVFSSRKTYMIIGTGKMLDQSSAESDVQQLMASADPEHGLAGRQEPVKRFKLKLVQVVIDRFLGDPLLAVTGRIDIPSSRQQETVIP